jgi:CheY-like chemotaxis protein
MIMMSQRDILLVEDDQVDAMTVRRALKDLRVTNPLVVAENGEQALEILRSRPADLPCMILSDINMPRMNGVELAIAVKSDPSLRHLPIVMLTTSREQSDRWSSFQQSVAGYLVKPIDYLQFVEMMRTLNMYWTLSEMPR